MGRGPGSTSDWRSPKWCEWVRNRLRWGFTHKPVSRGTESEGTQTTRPRGVRLFQSSTRVVLELETRDMLGMVSPEKGLRDPPVPLQVEGPPVW